MASTPDVGRAEVQKQEARWQRDTEAKGTGSAIKGTWV